MTRCQCQRPAASAHSTAGASSVRVVSSLNSCYRMQLPHNTTADTQRALYRPLAADRLLMRAREAQQIPTGRAVLTFGMLIACAAPTSGWRHSTGGHVSVPWLSRQACNPVACCRCRSTQVGGQVCAHRAHRALAAAVFSASSAIVLELLWIALLACAMAWLTGMAGSCTSGILQ
jgi:hypothetical protein